MGERSSWGVPAVTTKNGTILIKNIYYMLAYAFRSLESYGYQEIAGEEFSNIHDLFAVILAKEVSRQIKRGLYREYHSRTEALPTVRGKIDLQGAIGNKIKRERCVTCEYDELTENNPLNQILKTTICLLLRHGEITDERYAELRRILPFFSNIDEIDAKSIAWEAVHLQRNNQSYRLALGVCQLILEGMLLTTESGQYRLSSFVDSQQMHRLYEKFILEFYTAEYPFAKASSPQIKWALDDGAGTLLPTMQTDIALSRNNEVLIIDAKYYSHSMQYSFDTATIHSANLYQIFTYVKNKEAELSNRPHRVAGILLYAKTDEALQPEGDYRMSGNQIKVSALDLNRDFQEIQARLISIANQFFAA